MRRVVVVVTCWVAGVAAVVACTSDDEETTPAGEDAGTSSSSSSSSSGAVPIDSGPILDADADADASPPAEVCKLQASFECERRARCLPGALVIEYATEANCRRQIEAECERGLTLPGVKPLSASCFATPRPCEGPLYPDPACSFAGTRANGAPCESGRQCTSAWCEYGDFSSYPCGTCGPRLVVEAGASCEQNPFCEEPTWCIGGKCSPRLAEGSPCTNLNECQEPLLCIKDKCQPALEAGAPCDSTGGIQCASRPKALECTGDKCTEIRFAEADAACITTATETTYCVGTTLCSEPGAGICVPRIPLGGACNGFNPYCTRPEACDADAGKCRLPPSDRCR